MDDQKGNGALVGSIIIIVILIIGGIYLWKTSLSNRTVRVEQAVTEEDASAAADIETELDSMDLESLDEGI